MIRKRRLEESIKKDFGKIKINSFIMSNATSVFSEVSRKKWQEIEKSPKWAAVKKMIEDS